MTPAPRTIRFIAAIRRRVILIRLIESIGICAAIACAAAVVLLPILWYRGQSAIPLAEAALTLGIFAGIIHGLSRRPSLAGVAAFTDRQLHLNDLLGTALSIAQHPPGDRTTPEWAATVLAIAEHQCRDLTPRQLILRRLNSRAWSGIALCVALMLTLALFTGQTATTRANTPVASTITPADNDTTNPNPPSGATLTAPHEQQFRTASPTNPDEISNRTGSDQSPQNESTNSAEQNHPNQFPAPAAGSAKSTGSGMSITPANQNSPPPQQPNTTNNTSASLTGAPTAGVGRSNSHASASATTAGQTESPEPNRATPPPWQSANWPTDRRAAEQALQSAHIPDAAADLVRDYFRAD